MIEVRAGDSDARPVVIQAQVFASGHVHVWYSTRPGQRAFALLTDEAFSDGLAGLIGEHLADRLAPRPRPAPKPPEAPPVEPG